MLNMDVCLYTYVRADVSMFARFFANATAFLFLKLCVGFFLCYILLLAQCLKLDVWDFGFQHFRQRFHVRLSPVLVPAVASSQSRRELCESDTSEGIGDLPTFVSCR